MNSSYLNMAAGAFLGTVFVVMSVSIVSDALIHSEAPEEEGFAIEVAEAEAGGESAEAGPTPIANLLAEADASAGEDSFRKCSACHSVEEGGSNGVGPNLWGVVDRPIASVEGFGYSGALEEFSEGGEVLWDYEHLAGFLADPRGYVEGTAMSFAGLSREDELANVIAYLRELSNDPVPLPEPEEVAETDGEESAEGGEEGGSEDGPAVAMLGDADPENGESIFRRCGSCHSAEEGGANRVGPALWDVVEREVASVEDFNYSNGMTEYADGGEVAWSLNRLDSFLLSPRDEVEGTSMSFGGIRDDGDRADLLSYLASLSNDPVDLSGAGAEDGGDAEEDAAGEEESSDENAAEDGSADEEAAAEGEEDAGDSDEAEESSEEDEGTDASEGDDGADSEQEDASAEEASDDESAEAEGGSVVAMIADADIANGESVFAECSACHSAEEGGETLVGPNLWDIVNRDVAGVEDFEYTENFVDYGGEDAVWDYALLDRFLAAPMDEVEGTMMAYPGVEDDQNRADLIGYLRTLAGEPAELPAE